MRSKTTISINAAKIEGDILSNMVYKVNIQLEEAIVSDGICYEISEKDEENISWWKWIKCFDCWRYEISRSHGIATFQEIEFKEVYKILNGKGDQSKKLEENIGCLSPYLDGEGLIGQLKQGLQDN